MYQSKLAVKGCSAATLKSIAVITMLIDHIGAGILYWWIANAVMLGDVFSMDLILKVNSAYYLLRTIGRVALPIYAFLLVEGFMHTHNVKKYAQRLLIFAVISEVIFDLYVSGVWFDWSSQNILFLLFLALLSLQGMKWAKENGKMPVAVAIALGALVVAELANLDYGAAGMLLVFAMYWFHDHFWKMLALSAVAIMAIVMQSMLLQLWALAAFVPIYFYNGQKGKELPIKGGKLAFYWFYPVHFAILQIIKCLVV